MRRHQSVERLHLGLLVGIEVDDGNGRSRHVQLGFKLGQRTGNNPQDDLIAGAEGFARLRLEALHPPVSTTTSVLAAGTARATQSHAHFLRCRFR